MKSILFVSIFLCANLLFGQTATAPSVGDGSSGNPYQIATLNNLYWITAANTVVPSPTQTARWAYKYLQTADIDASSTSTWFSNGSGGYYGWSPIGNSSISFMGSYNGQGHSISGLYINTLANNVGFFGTANVGTISNLGIININIISTNGSCVGALIGSCGATVTNCYTTGNVLGKQYVGGFVGVSSGTVTSCYSSCNVSCMATSGSFVGFASGTIKNCYSRGNTTNLYGAVINDCGGFIGQNSGAAISYCFSTGSVIYIGTTNPVDKGFVGYHSSGSYIGNLWDTQTSSQSSTGGTAGQYAAGSLTSDLKTNSTFSAWDGAFWNIDAAFNNGYPYLKFQNPSGTPLPVELFFFTANVSNGRNVMLNWETKIEVNTNRFIIERNSNVIGWEPVAAVNAFGNHNSSKQYSFTVKDLQTGKYRFRLKIIDNDGSFQYGNIIETTIALPNNFCLSQNYPNPFNPSTKIAYTLPVNSKVSLEVFNIAGVRIGQLVNEDQPAGYYSVDFHSSSISKALSSGVYFYHLSALNKIDGTNFSSVKKMILLK